MKNFLAATATLIVAPALHASPVSLNLAQTPTSCLSITASGGQAAACGTSPQAFNIVSVTGGVQIKDATAGTCIQTSTSTEVLATCSTSNQSQVFSPLVISTGTLYKTTDGTNRCLTANSTAGGATYCDTIHYPVVLFAPTAVTLPATVSLTIGSDHKLHDQNGVVTKRFVDLAQLEQAAQCGTTSGYAAAATASTSQCGSDYWRGSPPDWSAIKSSGVEGVRLPISESAWIGGSCTWLDYNTGHPITGVPADVFGNYKSTISTAIAGATAQGLAVILDLHWTAPAPYCSSTQQGMPDSQAVTVWQQLAQTYAGSANVAFDLFNEPEVYGPSVGNDSFFNLTATGKVDPDGVDAAYDKCVISGCTANALTYNSNGNPHVSGAASWTAVGMQQLITTIRNAGAHNVIFVPSNGNSYRIYTVVNSPTADSQGSNGYSVTWQATDTLGQLAYDMHCYTSATGGAPGTACFSGTGRVTTQVLSEVQTNGSGPVFLGEFGDLSDAIGGTSWSNYYAAQCSQMTTLGLSGAAWSATGAGGGYPVSIWDTHGTGAYTVDSYGAIVINDCF